MPSGPERQRVKEQQQEIRVRAADNGVVEYRTANGLRFYSGASGARHFWKTEPEQRAAYLAARCYRPLPDYVKPMIVNGFLVLSTGDRKKTLYVESVAAFTAALDRLRAVPPRTQSGSTGGNNSEIIDHVCTQSSVPADRGWDSTTFV
jgi:hypothetical protein